MTVTEAEALLAQQGRAYKKSWTGVQVYKITAPGLVAGLAQRQATPGRAPLTKEAEALALALLATQGRYESAQDQAVAILQRLGE